MVIFLFLRNAWATIIPGVTVPLSLLGTAALMYVLVHYSLDNLSLMALTIAVGFVVDDAIVMLENIYRHIEAGPDAAGGDAQGRERDRLHHPVDQHLAGGGVHPAAADGRHRRPAVPRIRDHRDDDHRGLGVRGADAVADHVRASSCATSSTRSTGGPTCSIERGFDKLLDGYRRGLDFVLRHQRATLVDVHADRGADRGAVRLYSRRASFRSRTPASSSACRTRRRTSPSTRWCGDSTC